jgi:predicted amidohydrolase
MRITVCEVSDARAAFEAEWGRLVAHVHETSSQLVLLPDMPFCKWFIGAKRFDADVWAAAVQAHADWEHRLFELAPAYVLASRPLDFGNERYAEGFVWDAEHGIRSVHAKTQFDNEKGAWEKTWYRSTSPDFVPLELEGAKIGFLMGAELAAEDEAERYGGEHIDLLVMPRGSPVRSFDTWLSNARRLAQLAHAYVLSSNRNGAFGGQGCIIAPDGEVLGCTSGSQPFLTLDLSLVSDNAGAPRLSGDELAALDPWETGVPPH